MRQILKEALTVCLFIDETQETIYHNTVMLERFYVRQVKKIVKNFLRRMKQSEYYKVKDDYGDTFYDNIQDHLEGEKSHRSTAVYLTYLQMQFHSFVRHYLPKRMGYGNYRRNTKFVSYYKQILEVLLR